MSHLILRRLAMAPLMVVTVAAAVFFTARLLPGDPLERLVTEDTDPDFVPRLRRQMGLDRPPVVQFGLWLRGAVQGDWGESWTSRRPVAALVAEALPNTLRLTVVAFAMRWTLAVIIGIAAALRHGRRSDWALRTTTLVVDALPTFVLGVLLQLVFAYGLQWLPAEGMRALDAADLDGFARWRDTLAHLCLPVLVLGTHHVATSARFVRAAVLEASTRDHVLAARARGLSDRRVLVRHVLRNALGPLVTLFALSLPGLIGGSLIVETLFSWPGMGRLTVGAAQSHDQPVLLAAVALVATLVVLSNLAADVAAAAVDPRQRGEG